MSEHGHEHEVVGRTSDGHPLLHAPDGLVEADRPMPPWLRVVTWGTLLWGAGYLLWATGLVGGSGWSQNQSYAAEAAAAKLAAQAAPKPAGDALAAALADPKAIHEGEEAYQANCVACHGAGGAGGIGPKLSDATWLYGGKPEEVAHTLEKGTAKGMPPFGHLSSTTRTQLVAYVKSLSK